MVEHHLIKIVVAVTFSQIDMVRGLSGLVVQCSWQLPFSFGISMVKQAPTTFLLDELRFTKYMSSQDQVGLIHG